MEQATRVFVGLRYFLLVSLVYDLWPMTLIFCMTLVNVSGDSKHSQRIFYTLLHLPFEKNGKDKHFL